MGLSQAGHRIVSLAAGPIALELQEVLQRSHWTRAGLHHPLDSALMRLSRNVAASVRNHVDFKTLVDG